MPPDHELTGSAAPARLFKPLCCRCSTLNHHHPLGRAIAGKFVRDHHPRYYTVLLEQVPQQPLGCFRVTAALNQGYQAPSRVDRQRARANAFGQGSDHHSSRCRLSPGAGRRRRICLAKPWPDFSAHCRTFSWLTRMPRAASISSTMRRLNGNRK